MGDRVVKQQNVMVLKYRVDTATNGAQEQGSNFMLGFFISPIIANSNLVEFVEK